MYIQVGDYFKARLGSKISSICCSEAFRYGAAKKHMMSWFYPKETDVAFCWFPFNLFGHLIKFLLDIKLRYSFITVS